MTEKEISREILRKIGVFTVLILFLLSGLTVLFVKEFVLVRHYPIKAKFRFIADLKKGADVRFTGGIRIGYVRKISRAGSGVEVILNIMEGFPVREKAEISIFTVGMMGEKFVELDQNENSGNYIAPGTVLIGNDALSLEIFQISLAKLTQKTIYSKDVKIPGFQEVLDNINRSLRTYLNLVRSKKAGTSTDIQGFRESTEAVLRKVQNIQVFIERFKANIQTVDRADINDLFLGLRELEKDLSSVNFALENMIQISKNLKYETESIALQHNATGKLIFSRDLYKDIEKTLKEWENLSEKLADNPNYLFAR